MITFSNLGKYGRLGNQMFQYAAIIGIAKKSGYEWGFPTNNTNIIEFFDITSPSVVQFPIKRAHVAKTSYDSIVFELPDNLDYTGYFQTEKYFKHCSDFIKKEFTFKTEIKEKVDAWFGENKYVSIHIRRGDYVNLQNVHPIQSLEWYKAAMDLFPDTIFLIFSDDKEWCKRNFKNTNISPFVSSGEDLYAMSKCNGHIICNSSFSWWAAWLSGKRTIAPKIWYGPDGPQDWEDIYCEDWIKL